MIRKTVNLSGEDETALAPFFADDTTERAELAVMVGEDAISASDSAALVALARIGAKAVRERMLEKGYAELAAAWEEEDRAWLTTSATKAGAPRRKR